MSHRADFLALALLTALLAASTRGDDFSARRLEAAGIASDSEGIAAYLRSLLPDSGRAERAARLVEELGSEDFLTREAASRALATIPDRRSPRSGGLLMSPDEFDAVHDYWTPTVRIVAEQDVFETDLLPGFQLPLDQLLAQADKWSE